MALEPKKKTTKKKTTNSKAASKTTKTTKPTKTAKTTKAVKKPATKKKAVKKTATKKTTSEKKTEEEIDMNTSESTQSKEGIEKGLGNAKLEQTGTVADKVWRLIAMIAFAFMANFALFAIVVLSALQFVVVFMEDKPNKELQSIVDKLQSYLKETISFLSYKTDVMPFPFSSLPKNEE